MRRAALAALAAAAALAPAPASAASCGARLEWNGDTYTRTPHEATLRGRALGTAVLPGCEGPGDRVFVHAVRGVAPRFAVASSREPRRLFVNTAYPVRLPQHPLHPLLYRRRRWPTCRPTRHVTVVGELESLEDLLRVDAAAGPTALYVDDRTRMAPRFGRLASGDRIRVAAFECRFAGGPSVPFARRVTVLARAPRERTEEPQLLLAAAVTATLFALALGARALRRRSRAAPEP